MECRSCLEPYSVVYNFGIVHIKDKATISQYVYIFNRTNDLLASILNLMIEDIMIGANIFINAKA